MQRSIHLRKRQFNLGGFIVSALVPDDPYSDELLDAYPIDKKLTVDIKDDRNRGQNRHYWAGLGLLQKNLSEEDDRRWPSVRALHNMLLSSLGYTTRLYRHDGQNDDGTWRYSFTVEVDSIAFDNMGDEEFTTLFERAQALVVALWGYDPWDEWKNLKDEERRAAAVDGWQRNWRPGDVD